MENLLNICSIYFGHLTFTNIDFKNGYHIYGAGLNGFSDGTRRYVFLIVDSKFAGPKGDKRKIDEIMWKNLQVRTIQNGYALREQSFKQPRIRNDMMAYIVSRSLEKTIYQIEGIPISVEILHNLKKKSKYQYNDKITFSGILDTFSATITIRDEFIKSQHQPHAHHPPIGSPIFTPIGSPVGSTVGVSEWQPNDWSLSMNNNMIASDYETIL